jgi:hypothetical protein
MLAPGWERDYAAVECAWREFCRNDEPHRGLGVRRTWGIEIPVATGLAALRAMMRDRRLADPEKFAHIRVELGIDPQTEAKAAE